MTTSSRCPAPQAWTAALPLLLKQLNWRGSAATAAARLSRLRPRLEPRPVFPLCLCSRRWITSAGYGTSASCREAHLPWQKGLDGFDQQQDRAKHAGSCRYWPRSHDLVAVRPRIPAAVWAPAGVGKTHAGHSHHNGDDRSRDQPCCFFRPPLWCSCWSKAKASYELPAVKSQKLDRYACW